MSDRGPYAKGKARRAEILETALRVLAERGYRNTSLRGIGRELGLQPAHILHYFSSREELLEEVIRAWDSRESTTLHGMATLLDWTRIVRDNMTVPGLVHLYTALAAEATDPGHPSHQFFRNRFEQLSRHFSEAIVAAQEAGDIRPDVDPERAAINLIALSDGLQLQWLINPTIDMARELTDALDRIRLNE